jgi:hypothetical protein
LKVISRSVQESIPIIGKEKRPQTRLYDGSSNTSNLIRNSRPEVG